jgi:hypothetical protein
VYDNNTFFSAMLVGDPMGVDMSWTNSPTSYSYQWEDCVGSDCTPISGATASTYTLTSNDVGQDVAVDVTASNGSGASTPVLSTPAAFIDSSLTPVISGSATVGSTLTVPSLVPAPISGGGQWEDCDASGSSCNPISGTSGATSYTVQSSDSGQTIVYAVYAGEGGVSILSEASAPTAVVP